VDSAAARATDVNGDFEQ